MKEVAIGMEPGDALAKWCEEFFGRSAPSSQEHRSEPALPSVGAGEFEGVRAAGPVKPFPCLCKGNWKNKRVDSAAGCCLKSVLYCSLQ